MANVKVAVRVRPLSQKELEAEAINIVNVNEDVLSITNLKINCSEGDRHRERVKNYTFDHCYNSLDRQADSYASQKLIYQDLGTEVLNASFEGYNVCLFAYGQTGSGKTYTIMGDDVDPGLIPRICEGMCSRVDDLEEGVTFKIEVSYLEIYNERVRDLLVSENDANYTLKVREHPKDGPYVQDLTKHLVSDFDSVMMLIVQGNRNRTTATTHMHEASSRSHAIFTLTFVQAKMVNNMPSEIVSKINIVDLAGSERANLNYSKGRLQEGANINKSLVTLGNCISALGMDSEDDDAESSRTLSSGSMESIALSEDIDMSRRRPGFVPYRNSVLTWLLKDSLGGNSRTIMIATISPSCTYFNETMSTLRYARRAKRIVNQPLINEDPNVRLIRELRAEINRLKALLSSASLSSSQASLVQDVTISKMLAENEQKVDQLTEAWVDKWREAARIMQECNVGIRRESMGVIVESELPHLIGMDDDLLSTGIILYHLLEGQTTIGREDSEIEQDIVLWGPGIECQHAIIVNRQGRVTLHPVGGAACAVNGNDVCEPTQLSQGAVILLGKTNMFRFNHPAEAARLREKRASSLKPADVEEIRRPRKNSVTLRVHNNITAITEEGNRLRKISLSRETPPSISEGLSLSRGRSPNTTASPAPEVSAIMMYNPGVELERQHKIKVEKVERTRKRLEEIQDKTHRAEAAHKEEQQRMKIAYEDHQRMIQEQRNVLQRLRDEHKKIKVETEKELQEMREALAREREQGQTQLEEQQQTLRKDQAKKASVSALDGAAFSPVVAKETQPPSDLSVLDVDRKRLTQLELLHRQSQHKARAALERRQAAFDRQRSASLRLIEQEERRLHEIECIPSLSDHFASASSESLNSSLRSEDDMSNGTGGWSSKESETQPVIGWARVSPIGGRSDSDSANSRNTSTSSDKEENVIISTNARQVIPSPNLDAVASNESDSHKTKATSKARHVSTASNKPHAAASSAKTKTASSSVFSRLYQQQKPKFDFLRRRPQAVCIEEQSHKQMRNHQPKGKQRSLTDGAIDITSGRGKVHDKPTHSKSHSQGSSVPAAHSQSRDSLKTKSMPRTKSMSPSYLREKGPLNKIPPSQNKKNMQEVGATDATTLHSKSRTPKLQPSSQRSQTPVKSETKLPAASEQKLSGQPRRTKMPTSESAIEAKKSHEKTKSATGKDLPVTEEKSLPKGKESKNAVQPRISKTTAKPDKKLGPKQTTNSEAFFVTLSDESDTSKNAEKRLNSSDLNDLSDVFHEEQRISLERQPAIGCSESMEDVGTVLDVSTPGDIVKHFDNDFLKEDDASSETNETYSDSLEDLKEQNLSAYQPHDIENEDQNSSGEVFYCENGSMSPRRRKNGFSMEMEDHFSVQLDEVLEDSTYEPEAALMNDSEKFAGLLSLPTPEAFTAGRSASGLSSENHTQGCAAELSTIKETDPDNIDKIISTDGKDDSADKVESETSGQKNMPPISSKNIEEIVCGIDIVNKPKAECVHVEDRNQEITRKVQNNEITQKCQKVETDFAQKHQDAQSLESESVQCGNSSELETKSAEHKNGDDPPLCRRFATDGASVHEGETEPVSNRESHKGAILATDEADPSLQTLSLTECSVPEPFAKSLTQDKERVSKNDLPKESAVHSTSPSAISLDSEVSDANHKSGKQSEKCRTAIKYDPSQNKSKQEPESSGPTTVWKSTCVSHLFLSFGLSRHDTEDQPSRCSSSLSTCSTSTYSSELSKSDSLHSRSPDDEVALISDGVSDPPDLSDLPATPTDLIVKPLPSPKTLVESVFWDSSSSKSYSSEKLVDDGRNIAGTVDEVLKGNSDHSSDVSCHDDKLADDQMENSGDLTVLAVEQLNDATLQNTTQVELCNPETSRETSVKYEDCDYQPSVHPTASLSREMMPDTESVENGASFTSQDQPHDGLIKDLYLPSSDELHVQVIPEGEGSVNSHAFVSRLYIEPFQKTLDLQSKDSLSRCGMSSMDKIALSSPSEFSSMIPIQQDLNGQGIKADAVCNSPEGTSNSHKSRITTHQPHVSIQQSTSIQDKLHPVLPKLERMAMSGLPDEESTEHRNNNPQYKSKMVKIVQPAKVGLSHLYIDQPKFSQPPSLEAEETMLPKSPFLFQENDLINRHTGTSNEGDMASTLDNRLFQVMEATSDLDDVCQCSGETIPLKNSHANIELRENMIPDGASVEAKADEPQTSIKRYVNLSQIQKELIRLHVILSSVAVNPLSCEVEQAHSAGDVSTWKSLDTREILDVQVEASQSNTPDSTSDELSLIEQLRGLSEKLGPSLSKDTPDIINRARCLSDHLEHAHSSVYSPSLVEELRELSKQLNASWFLTIEKSDQVALSLDEKQKDCDRSALFHSAQDLTLYQTAFEVTQENLYPVPPSSLLVSPVPVHSTPVSNECDPCTLSQVLVGSPTASPFNLQSSSHQHGCFDAEYSLFVEEDLSDGNDSAIDEDGAIHTAERVISEMSSFTLQLDILSGSDTVGDDNDSDSNSSEGLNEAKATEWDDDHDDKIPQTQEVSSKTRPSLSSRNSLECFLPTICEECLSSSDTDEAIPGYQEERSAQNNGQNDPYCERAVSCKLCDQDANEPGTVNHQSTQHHVKKEENLATNMSVHVCGSNWEIVGESSEGSVNLTPIQAGTMTPIHTNNGPCKGNEPEVDHRITSPFASKNGPVVLTYDESAQTDWLTEEDLASQMWQKEVSTSSMEQVDHFSAAHLKSPSGVNGTNRFVQTTLSQARDSRSVHVSSLYLQMTNPVHDVPHVSCTSPCLHFSHGKVRPPKSLFKDDDETDEKNVKKQEQTCEQSDIKKDISSLCCFFLPGEPLLTKTMVVLDQHVIDFPPCKNYGSADPNCVIAAEDREPSSIENADKIHPTVTIDSLDMIVQPELDFKELITPKPTDPSDGAEKEIPDIRLFGPVEEVLLKEAVTVRDDPIIWPTTENPNSESNRSSCESANNSLFQPIREESNSGQSAGSNPDPSGISLPLPDETGKASGHEQQLQIPVEHSGDKNLKDLKELSTAMGLSPQRSYSTDEELIQIFSKGVAHFRSLKQDAMTVKPVLVAVATNTSPVKTGLEVTKVDAAVMTNMEVEKAHAYTSMSPEFEQELLLNSVEKITPQQVEPNARFSASQLVSRIVENTPEKLVAHQKKSSNCDNLHVHSNPIQIDCVAKSELDPVDPTTSGITSLSMQEPQSVNQQPQDLNNLNSEVPENTGESSSIPSPSPKRENTLGDGHAEVHSSILTQNLESLDATFAEQRLLAELRKRTWASQQAAKRAMAFALELRQKNFTDRPSGKKDSTACAQQLERKTPESGEEDLAKLDHKMPEDSNSGQVYLMKRHGPKARSVEDKESKSTKNCPIYEMAHQECIHPGYSVERFMQNILELMQNTDMCQSRQSPDVASHATIKLNQQPNLLVCKTGALNSEKLGENAKLFQPSQLKDEEKHLDLVDDCHQQMELSHSAKQDGDLESNSHSPFTDNEPVLEMVNEQFKREAICILDSDSLILRFAKIRPSWPVDGREKPKTNSLKTEQVENPIEASFSLPSFPEGHTQEQDIDPGNLRPQKEEPLKLVNIKKEFNIHKELVKQERVSTVPTSEDIKTMLDNLTDTTKANDNVAETGTKQHDNFDASSQTMMPPKSVLDDSGKTTTEGTFRRKRFFTSAFSDISFDLENDDDDDLRALKEMNKNIDRAIAETSSPESDFEDDMEPELVELADDETDTCSFVPPASGTEVTISAESSLREPPQKVMSAPAALFPQRCDNSVGKTDKEEKEEEEEDVSSWRLRGILISPDKLEWLLADSESGSSSTRSSPKEKDLSSKSNGELIAMPSDDFDDDKFVVETTQGKVNKQQGGLAEADQILSQTWPLKKRTESQFNDKPTLENEIQQLKNKPGIETRSLETYPFVKYQDCHTQGRTRESNTCESRASPDSLTNSLTQSSGVFSASTRDTDASWLREGRLSQHGGSIGSEGEEADFSKIYQEYHNILADTPESETNQYTSSRTPTNAFTQTDEESLSSSGTMLNESSDTDLETSLGSAHPSASWPGRDPIPDVATKLDKRRDIAVELMEASLMHGIGETDAFLKFLDGDLPLEDWKSPDVRVRHRRSRSLDAPSVLDAEASRHEPSPSKFKPWPGTMDTCNFQSQSLMSDHGIQPVSITPLSDEGAADSSASSSPSPKCLPSENRRFLQQLRSKIVLSTSTQRPERGKINALLQDSWMDKMSSRTSEENSKPTGNAPNLNNDIEALLEESRSMREKSRAEIAKAEQNLNYARPFMRQKGETGSTQRASQNLPQDEKRTEHYITTWNGYATGRDAIHAGARPKSISALLSDTERLHPQERSGNLTDGNQGRPRRPHSAQATLDTFNCTDAIEREIQCLRAASAAMSRHSSSSSDMTSLSAQPHCGHTTTRSEPPPPQRYLHSYDRQMPHYLMPVAQSFTGDLGSQNLHVGTMPPSARPQHAHVIPIIALHPPSPDEEIDPLSIPAIARANQVLMASYRTSETPLQQDQARRSFPPSRVFSENDERHFPDVSKTQPNLKGSGGLSSSSEARSSQSPSPPKASTFNSLSSKGRSDIDSPEVPLSSSPPRRSGKHGKRSSQEKMNQELAPIIETPLDSWVTLYQLVADQAMAYLIRETTLTGSINHHLPQQPSEISGWRYLGHEKDTLLWHKTNKYCCIDSFLGLSILRAPARTIFNFINNSTTYNCLHECITNVKLLHKIDNTMKVVRIQCAMDHCSLQQPREFCCVITQAQKHGRWYIVSASVKHPLCPVVSSTVRGQIDLQGDLTTRLINRLTTRLPLCLAHLRKCVEIGQL